MGSILATLGVSFLCLLPVPGVMQTTAITTRRIAALADMNVADAVKW